MDESEQVVFDSEFSCGVLGRAGEFVLVPLNEGPVEDAMAAARERGFAYCGILAVLDGQAGAKCAPNPDAVFTMLMAALSFARLAADRLRPKSEGDGVEWLTALLSLPDTRN